MLLFYFCIFGGIIKFHFYHCDVFTYPFEFPAHAYFSLWLFCKNLICNEFLFSPLIVLAIFTSIYSLQVFWYFVLKVHSEWTTFCLCFLSPPLSPSLLIFSRTVFQQVPPPGSAYRQARTQPRKMLIQSIAISPRLLHDQTASVPILEGLSILFCPSKPI